MAKDLNGPSTDPKPFHRSTSNSTQFITFGELLEGKNSSSADQRGPAHKGSTYKLSAVTFYSFFVRYLAQRPAETARPILTIYTSDDAVSRKKVPFWGPNACKNFQGVHFPQKQPKIGPPMGISSLN